MTRLCIATGSDSSRFDYLRGAIESVHANRAAADVQLCVFDLGLLSHQRDWIAGQASNVVEPDWCFDFPGRDNSPLWLRGLLARPFLKEFFPGAEVYLWLDADAFVLDWAVIKLFCAGALSRGLAIVPELDRGSRLQFGKLPIWWANVADWYAAAFGPEVAQELKSYPVLNAGVFAMHRDAPHWNAWNAALERAVRNGVSEATDQTALNYAVYMDIPPDRTEFLPAWCNWGCHMGWPSWDLAADRLVEPCLPHTPIGILHRSGPIKSQLVEVPCTTGGCVPVRLCFPPRLSFPELPVGTLSPGEYVSPGLSIVWPDTCFPNLVSGDPKNCSWPYLRRDIGHRWLVDCRAPGMGFVNRDEAAILHNTALRFRGRRGLEIGSWLGWSTCHIAMAGVVLDAVDPELANPVVRQSVESSLSMAGIRGLVNLVASASPAAVPRLAGGRKWSFFFIDGDHESPAPTLDAQACAAHATDDALILFHDAAAPAVAAALDWLRDAGWQTALYQTMQILGVAWRGQIEPLHHQPDPSVEWTLPRHVANHPVRELAGP